MEKTYKQIAELIRIELLKRGFMVDVTCYPEGEDRVKIETSSFQTTPVIFKRLWIDNSFGCIVERQYDEKHKVKYTDYSTTISVNYETFSDGMNATTIFRVRLRVLDGRVYLMNIK